MASPAYAPAHAENRVAWLTPDTADSSRSEAIGGQVWSLIGAIALVHLALAASLPLTPQEAYYWLWSRDLAWSYFDHPPLAAYSIALTTTLFGATSFGIKVAAVAWSVALSATWARLITDVGWGAKIAFWSVLAINLVGIIAAYGVVIAPDAPLLTAWSVTLWAVWRAAVGTRSVAWIIAGVALGCALLAKYTAILLLPIVGLWLLLSRRQRGWLVRPEPWIAIAVAAVVFSPVIIWNAQHDWASFAFQSTQRAAGMTGWQPRYAFQLVATQLLVATPYLLAVALAAWWMAVRSGRKLLEDEARLLLVLSATIPLLLFGFASLRSMVKPNWLAPIYPPLIALAVYSRLQSGTVPRNLKVGLATSAALLAAAFVVMSMPNARLGEANTWSGWPEAARRIDQLQQQLAANGTRSFVFSTNYKNSALLAFHLRGQPRTYAQDIYGERALQFDYWPAEALVGESGILVLDNRRDATRLPQALIDRFQSIRKVDTVVAGDADHPARVIELYVCEGYRGHPRAELALP